MAEIGSSILIHLSFFLAAASVTPLSTAACTGGRGQCGALLTTGHKLRRRAGRDASDVIASAESLICATTSSIPARSSHVLAVAVRMHVAVVYSAVVT